MQRTDFAPDGNRAVLFGLKLTNPGAARTVNVSVDAHSELFNAYPWGTTTPYSAADEPADQESFSGHDLDFTNDGPPVPGRRFIATLPSSALIGRRAPGSRRPPVGVIGARSRARSRGEGLHLATARL